MVSQVGRWSTREVKFTVKAAGTGEWIHAVSTHFTALNYRPQDEGERSKRMIKNGFNYHLFLYRIDLERKFREAT